MPARTGQFEDLGCGIVLKSIGYKSKPVNGLPFDNQRSVVPNVRGRLISEASGDHTRLEKGFYVCGWWKRGPTGIIATNLYCAEETLSGIVHYLKVTKIRCIFVQLFTIASIQNNRRLMYSQSSSQSIMNFLY
uniref:NADPH:adrenodoxin oxidoreductase, mitochondrial-like n=1 Tax=Fragaria vesca subsp. vesca TaxID=101020 RepID=UPI0005C95700|nr:PREDICTED: NADPH:adrenodoxin oxidoreductase, mitochondrial-like [Fragaria vesca subsp. vesca]